MKCENLYNKYHVERQDERRNLFEIIKKEFNPRSGLYPGCFVHVTPSFYFQEMYYVDSDTHAARFFKSRYVTELITREKLFEGPFSCYFFQQNYTHPLSIPEDSIDLLISQYAGFVGESCKKYLKSGGILAANNSHGDAGLVQIDEDFQLIAVIDRQGDRFSLSQKDLNSYFILHSKSIPTEKTLLYNYLKRLGKGLKYDKRANTYVFRKR